MVSAISPLRKKPHNESQVETAPGPAPVSSPSRSASLWLALIVGLGALLRIYGLAHRSIWYDEGFTIAFSKKLGFSTSYLDPSVTSDAPILPFLVRLMAELLARVPLAAPGSQAYDAFLRAIPCALSVITILLCYAFVRLVWDDKKVALVAAFLCAVSPFHIYYAQELKPYSLLLAVSLAAAIFLIRALETDRPFDWLALAFLLGIGMYAHLFAVWNILLANVYFAATIRRRYRLLPQWTAAQCIAGAISAPFIVFAYRWSRIYEQIQIMWALRPDFKTPFITFKTFFAGYGATSWAYWPLFLLGLGLFVYGLWRMRRNPDRLVLLLTFTALPIAANVLIWRYRHFPFYEHRTFIFASVFVYASVAEAWVNLRPKFIQTVAAVAMAALMTVCLHDYYAQNLHPIETHRMGVRYKVQNREAAAYIATAMRPGDIVAHAAHFTYFPFLHYLPGARQHSVRVSEGELTGFVMAGPNTAMWANYGALPVMLDEAVRGAARVWYVESWWEPFNVPRDIIEVRRLHKQWLNLYFSEKETRTFDGISVTLYESRGNSATR